MSDEYSTPARDIDPVVVDLDHGERLVQGVSLVKVKEHGVVGLSYSDGTKREVPADEVVRVRPWP
ncbi:hypothetical protein [Actinomycetospora sp. TBRC 11914]|uniref:hypothetical protein n=1 Tax=Actinomycetospora sp. TBRC 11914 TaxID=2729387 RepID=UPI00145DED41|nr:hypothetical protein [Actinomycetospora sp. TBRC 11914]NMO93872.1 hypothetical protein [Actinomycetospora sp. TBRC 11914]